MHVNEMEKGDVWAVWGPGDVIPLQTLIRLSAESNLADAERDCRRKLDWEGFRIYWPPTEPDDWQESDSDGEGVEKKGEVRDWKKHISYHFPPGLD